MTGGGGGGAIGSPPHSVTNIPLITPYDQSDTHTQDMINIINNSIKLLTISPQKSYKRLFNLNKKKQIHSTRTLPFVTSCDPIYIGLYNVSFKK